MQHPGRRPVGGAVLAQHQQHPPGDQIPVRTELAQQSGVGAGALFEQRVRELVRAAVSIRSACPVSSIRCALTASWNAPPIAFKAWPEGGEHRADLGPGTQLEVDRPALDQHRGAVRPEVEHPGLIPARPEARQIHVSGFEPGGHRLVRIEIEVPVGPAVVAEGAVVR